MLYLISMLSAYNNDNLLKCSLSLFSWLMQSYHRNFLPFRRADLTPSASLRPIRGTRVQLHGSCLAATATSSREYSKVC